MVSTIRPGYEVLRISIQALHLFLSKNQSNNPTLLGSLKYIKRSSIIFSLLFHVNKAGMNFKTLLLVLAGIRFTLTSPLLAGRGEVTKREEYTRAGLEAEFKGE